MERKKIAKYGVLLWMLMLAPAAWFFVPVLARGESFVFRDAAHYYYPSFYWQREEWRAGRVPLWNPLEACGANMATDATASVFYPLKLIFALPISFARCYVAYIALHVLLAAAGTWLVARSWKIEASGAAAGAIAYAYGGSVLFQYCNVAFLVGAAWLPFALLCAERMLARRSVKWAIALGAALALMTLGGDPQMAYNAMLVAAIYAVILWRSKRTSRLTRSQRRRRGLDLTPSVAVGSRLNDALRSRPALLVLAGLAAFALAAVQIVPAYTSAQQSRRAAYTSPRTVYEAIASSPTRKAPFNALFGDPAAGEHAEQIYQFSVGPWRWMELVIPNVGGRQFPENRRWMSVIPSEGRVWSPSLYCGLAPFLAMVGAAVFLKRRSNGEARNRWLSWTAALSLIASLGAYGAGWLIEQFTSTKLGEPVGGLYWLMVVALPGYVAFRYPAKLMVIAAMAMSLLAARGWRPLIAGETRCSRIAPWIVVAFAVASAMLLLVFRGPWETRLAEAPADNLFGPLDAAGATHDLLGALVHASLAALAVVAAQYVSHRRGVIGGDVAAVVFLSIDVIVAHSWFLPSAPEKLWTEPSPLEQRLHAEEESGDANARFFRAVTTRWNPSEYGKTTSPERQRDGLRHDRETLFPRYGLLAELAAVAPRESTEDILYYELFRADPYRADGSRDPHQHWLDVLGTRYAIAPRSVRYSNLEREWTGRNVELWQNPDAFPRAWSVRHGEAVAPVASRDLSRIRIHASRILFIDHQSKPRDFRQSAIVETRMKSSPSDGTDRDDHRITVVGRNARCVELKAHMASPAWVILAERYDSSWIAESRQRPSDGWTPREICRANGALRAVYLPAGDHQLVFRFRPTQVVVCGAASSAAWALALLFGGVWVARHSPFSISPIWWRRGRRREN